MKRETAMTITDPHAPSRLRGRIVHASLDDITHKLDFKCEVPDDLTANERGYLSWSIGELVDTLKEQFPDMIGNKTESIQHAEK